MTMTEQLAKINKVHTSLKVLTINQVVYVLGLMHNIDIPADAEDIKLLTEEGLLVNNALHEDIKTVIQDMLDKDEEVAVPVTTKSKFTKASQKTYDTLATSFHTGISAPDLTKYTKFANGDIEAAVVFYTFLSIMPSSSTKNNKKWDETFNTTYTGVTLRRLTAHTAKKFMQKYKKCDAGILCLALFLFVKDGVSSDGKCFIKKIDTFFKEFDSWYEDATDAIDNRLSKIEKIKTEQAVGRRII